MTRHRAVWLRRHAYRSLTKRRVAAAKRRMPWPYPEVRVAENVHTVKSGGFEITTFGPDIGGYGAGGGTGGSKIVTHDLGGST